MELAEYIKGARAIDAETLQQVQTLVARYPYFQTARLLLLQSLYQLHDSSFTQEFQQSMAYVADRSFLFRMMEGKRNDFEKREQPFPATPQPDTDRTTSLINNFLAGFADETPSKRKVVADPMTDYAAYLLQMEDAPTEQAEAHPMQGNALIDDFIERRSPIVLPQGDDLEYPEDLSLEVDGEDVEDEDFFTETLAKIYIKQERYDKALEIIRKLKVDYPKKNSYFADQIRFLEKLVINNQNKK